MELNALELQNVTKRYEHFALQNVSLALEKGAVMGLVGENGAGKTTLARLIMNQCARDGGQIQIFGMDNISDEPAVKNLIGYIADESYLHESGTLEKYRRIFSKAYERWDDFLFESLCKRFSLDTSKRFTGFSKGARTMAMLALALAHHPRLLLMDEPTAGLDPVARAELLDMLREFVADGESSVLFSTHITSDLDKIADYVTLLIDGQIIETMSIDAIEERYALITGEGSPNEAVRHRLIGPRQGASSYTALVRREDIPGLGEVSVRTPNIEHLLTHHIWQRKGAGAPHQDTPANQTDKEESHNEKCQ